jgi:aminopeptidase N
MPIIKMQMRIRLLIFSLLTTTLLQAQAPDSLWDRSLQCFKQQNFHGVIAYLDTLLIQVPEYPNALFNRGIARINLGDTEGACIDLRRAQEKGLSEENREFVDYMCNPDYIRNIILKQAYNKEKVYPELGYRPLYTRADTLRGSLRPERTCFDVYFYDLRIKINPKTKKIEGSNGIYFHVVEPTRKIQIDLFDNYKISGIFWHGSPLTWHREYNAIFIDFPQELLVGENHNITITYRGKPDIAPNPPWDGGFVWKRDQQKNLWVGVACEHLGASSWWPNKDHLTDKPDSMRMSFEIPTGHQAVSNGNLVKVEAVNKNYNRFTWAVDYPINNYNVTFYIGNYASFSDTLIQGNDSLRLDYNVLTYNLDTAREHFKQCVDVVSFYNKAFGFYPFSQDGFGLVESPYEGMEHQSAIAYGHGYNKNNAQDYRNQIYDYIIVHEAAHEWWGNSVTAGDMADIWIHEGFATYAEFMFLESRFGKNEYMYELTDKSRYIFNIWPMVQHRNVNENAFASNDVYNKGAMLLHCLRCTINNDSIFFRILHDFCVSNRYQIVNSQDFVDFVNHSTGSDFTAFFNKYLYDTKLPVLDYTFTNEQGDLVLRYRWTGVEEGFIMPFGIATSRQESLRLVADTSWKELRIPNTAWFNFYNLWKGYEGSPDNSFTYFYTHWGER